MKKLALLFISLTFSLQLFASGSVVLNGKNIKNKAHLHEVLARGLDFPPYYGKNLDALFDILVSDFSAESVIKIKNLVFLKKKLGSEYTQEFLEVIGAASEANPRIILILE
jgi:ribonuclease inhibitor